jgi:deoxyribonuclease-4
LVVGSPVREGPARALGFGAAAALASPVHRGELSARVRVLLETTAGTGTALGSTFEELAELRGLIPADLRRRVGFCADTCHLYSAGYDLVGDFDGVWAHWDRVLGLRRLGALHLND